MGNVQNGESLKVEPKASYEPVSLVPSTVGQTTSKEIIMETNMEPLISDRDRRMDYLDNEVSSKCKNRPPIV